MKNYNDFRKVKLVLKRWLDLICLTAVSVLICILLQPLISLVSHYFIKVSNGLPVWIDYLIIILITGFLWLIIIRFGGFRFSDVSPTKFLSYPPVWAFAFLGTIFYVGLMISMSTKLHNANHVEIVKDFSPYIGLGLLGFILSGLLNNFLSYKSRRSSLKQSISLNASPDFQSILDNPVHLIDWINKDKPITHPSEDLFELSTIARHISYYLLSPDIKTIGVIGPFGSGKSSLLNLIEYYLHNKDEKFPESKNISKDLYKGQLLIGRVDGWGRQKGSIAQQILTIAVESISRHVDCLSLLTMPAHYRSALTGTGNALASVIAALLSFKPEPILLLEKLDDILTSANLRLIIFLEDVDRNYADEIIKDEMPALLDRLKHLHNVSFVLAISDEYKYAEIVIRVCEHQESLT